eukprot:318_1
MIRYSQMSLQQILGTAGQGGHISASCINACPHATEQAGGREPTVARQQILATDHEIALGVGSFPNNVNGNIAPGLRTLLLGHRAETADRVLPGAAQADGIMIPANLGDLPVVRLDDGPHDGDHTGAASIGVHRARTETSL